MYSQTDVLTFISLFSGAKEFYGVTEVGEIIEGKAQSNSKLLHEAPGPSVYTAHLKGDISIGISPLKADNTVTFGAIDIDNYDGNLNDIVSAIYYHDLPICPCYSKSKKLHLYFFFEVGTEAEAAVEIMRWYARSFACDKKVEIFPKQIVRSITNKAYSWINLPYFNTDDETNHRKMLKQDLTFASLEEFIERAQAVKLSKLQHEAKIRSIPCWDAPPCIITGVMLRDVGQGSRNAWLFSTAVYLKLKDDAVDLDDILSSINESLKDPLPHEELKATILKSLQRQSYFYLCKQLPRCDKPSCIKLEYGVGSKKSTGLVYGKLTQVMTDPPAYRWEVSGQEMKFDTESELLTQTKFRCLCLRQLHKVPRPVSEESWSRIISKACDNIEVIYPDSKSGDFSTGSVFYDLACGFFSDKRRAQNISQVYMGRVFTDETSNEYVFTASTFVTYMRDTKNFKGLTPMEMRGKLEDMGAYKVGPIWRIPTKAFDKEDLNKTERVEVDLDLHEGESNDF